MEAQNNETRDRTFSGMMRKGAKAGMEDMMEAQNNEMTDKLASKVEILKQISLNIGKEVEEQNKELDQHSDAAGDVMSSLNGTMKGLMDLASSSGTSGLMTRACGMFGFFLVVYFFFSRYTSEP
mmetsp:Transcript_21366/g.42861  ORF Transcript_21366/g.42861 Transcript_21366/m.42861 type:complete len:124 (-) Transcript_21366:411-782(-)